jgi:endonuclease III
MIVHENAAYLVDDARRDEVYESQRARVGTRPAALLKAGAREVAGAIARGGMQPERRARKLIDAAEIVMEEFGGGLRAALALPEKEARRALKLFPGVGDPGADRIFLYTRTHPILALDSNALRVLLRLGYGVDGPNYAKSYRSAQAAAGAELPREFDALIAAGRVLREHGQELCRRKDPECPACPVRRVCPFAAVR